MAFVAANRVQETTTTTGTGTLNLGGAVSGYQSFVDGAGNGASVYYTIWDGATGDWEVGSGVVTDGAPDTLTRAVVYESSNAGGLVSLAAGTKRVFLTHEATLDYLPGNFTAGSVLFVGTGGVIAQDNANMFWDDSNNELGIGTTSPDSKLHVMTSSAGAVTALSNTVITAERNGDANVSILVPDANTGGLVVGSPADPDAGIFRFDVPSTSWVMHIGATPAYVSFFTSGVLIGANATPDSRLHVYNSPGAGAVSAQTDTVVTVENFQSAYLSFLTPNTFSSGILFGDVNDNDVASIIYSHSTNVFTVTANATAIAYVGSGGLGVGTGGAASARIHSKVGSTDAIPCLELEQDDADKAFIEFDATSAASVANPLTSWKQGHTLQGFGRVTVNGSDFWMPYYSAPSVAASTAEGQYICNGRLTTESGVAVSSSDRTSQSTLYFTPHGGNMVSLYDGSAGWKIFTFSERSLALSGLTSARPYDVFLYSNAGTLTLEVLAWTNDTTRATAITLQDGVYVRSGSTTRRYLGTIYTTATTTTEDSLARRYVWNYYNQVSRPVSQVAAGSVAAYTTASTYRAAGGDNNVRCNVVAGLAGYPLFLVGGASWASSVSEQCEVSFGIDSTTAADSNAVEDRQHNNNVQFNLVTHTTMGSFPIALGYHYAQLIEKQSVTTSTTWARGVLRGVWPC